MQALSYAVITALILALFVLGGVSIVFAQEGAVVSTCPSSCKESPPCPLSINGTQKGVCNCGICMGTGFSAGGGQAGGAVDAGQKLLQGVIDKVMQTLQGGGAGGTGSELPNAGVFNDPNRPEENTGTAGRLLQNIGTIDVRDTAPSAFQILSNAFGGSSNNTTVEQTSTATTNSPNTTVVAATTSQTTQGEGVGTLIVGANVQSGVGAQSKNAGKENNNEHREENIGVGSFLGNVEQKANTNSSIVGRVCAARPWQNGLMARLFSSSFFDSLCGSTSQEEITTVISTTRTKLMCPESVVLGESANLEWICGGTGNSAGVGFDTKGLSRGTARVTPIETSSYHVECAQGGIASCSVSVVGPVAQLIASPSRVALGARTRLYWVSNNAVSCELSGPGLKEVGLRGAATTNAILDEVKFTLTCKTERGNTISDSVTVGVGI